MWVLQKKISQSLRVSPENPFDRNFLKICSVIIYNFVRNAPNLQICFPAPVPPTALNIKGVVASYSLCG